MPEADLFLLYIRPLNNARIPYIIGGSIASAFYGEPRLTFDVDLIVFLDPENVRRIPEIFPDAEFYVPPLETITEEALTERGHFNLIHFATGFKADFYNAGRDELNAWGFRFKKDVPFHDTTVTLAPPEYVIVRKLEYFREGGSEEHLRDIRSILAVSAEQIRMGDLMNWIQRLNLASEWRRVEK
jgi:hypothetical protein